MKKIQINRIAVYDFEELKEAIDFDDWIIEVDHWKQLEPQLNEIRDIAKKIFRAKYKAKVFINLIHQQV